jgi:hypothetical protein
MTLVAHETYWGSRPFVDAVQIETGRSLTEQSASLEVGRADFVSLQALDVRRLASRHVRVSATSPLELVAIVFDDRGVGAGSGPLRRAVALAIDRASMCSVLMQGHAVPAAGVLPDWISGYATLLATEQDRTLARASAAAVPAPQRRVTLGFAESDGLLKAIAERIAVDAREVGLPVTLTPPGAASSPDARLVRVRLDPTTRERALVRVLSALDPQGRLWPAAGRPTAAASLEDAYRFERALGEHAVLVPLVHLPELYGTSPAVESWRGPIVQPTGDWNLANAWLRIEAR